MLTHTRPISPPNGKLATEDRYSVLDLAGATRFVLMITPQTRGTFDGQIQLPLAEHSPQDPIRESGALSFGDEDVAVHAHELWEARGCPDGSPDEDWFRATQQLQARKEAAK